ncbi:MAG: hypothetical protein LBJ41_07360 [Treponema sp.]|jgi:hypothetical protein|nr:hypothetical protein [Treponema sp.]
MKNLVFGGFGGVASTFSGILDEVVLDENVDGGLGHFDLEVVMPKRHGGRSFGAQDPAIRDAIKKEIAKRGGTRAIDITIRGYETADAIFARVIGTVVK